MRLIESLTLIALLFSLLAYLVPESRRPGWLSFFPALAALFAVLHLIVEGYRWQMVPAYVLTATVVVPTVWGVWRNAAGQREAPSLRSRILAFVGIALGLAIVWLAVELCVQVPAFHMPTPGGSYDVGTRAFLLVDESRPDDDSPVDNGYRTMSIQAWYPAELTGEEERVTYLRSDIRKEMEELIGMAAWYNSYLDQIPTHAHWDARIASADESFPVILYSPSGNASLHKILFEELASRGYVAVSISHPHWNNVIYDDQGAVITQGGVGERYQAWFREADKQAVRSAQELINSVDDLRLVEQAQIQLNRARPIAIAELRQWAEDDGFVLDQLAEMNQPGGFFEGRLDLFRIGVMGFSLGGATAGQFCVTDARCQAGINVDGFMFGDILDHNLKVPFMFFHSAFRGVRPVGALFFERAENSAYMLQVAGSTHHDLGAPAPTGQPIVVELGLNPAQFPDGAYLARIMNDYILSFFDKHLRDRPASLLDGPSPYPEVTFMKKAGN